MFGRDRPMAAPLCWVLGQQQTRGTGRQECTAEALNFGVILIPLSSPNIHLIVKARAAVLLPTCLGNRLLCIP